MPVISARRRLKLFAQGARRVGPSSEADLARVTPTSAVNDVTLPIDDAVIPMPARRFADESDSSGFTFLGSNWRSTLAKTSITERSAGLRQCHANCPRRRSPVVPGSCRRARLYRAHPRCRPIAGDSGATHGLVLADRSPYSEEVTMNRPRSPPSNGNEKYPGQTRSSVSPSRQQPKSPSAFVRHPPSPGIRSGRT